MYDINSTKAKNFIDHEEIEKTIQFAYKNANNKNLIDNILKKARLYKGLNHKEALVLLLCNIKEKNLEIFQLAKEIKKIIYGNRIVLFAPLYISNYCVNGCKYCPYCKEKTKTKRIKLSQQEIKQEVIALYNMGHKRIALETGEDDFNCPIEYILESIDTIYNVKDEKNLPLIRRINVNIAATTVENYKKLKNKNIGTYVLFQETYNQKAYEKFHPYGPKSSYEYHTTAMDRALSGKIDDIGLGVLFGLTNYEYDFTALLMHKEHLESVFKIGPHTISVPRLKPANDVDLSQFKLICDETLLKIIACFRIAVPYTGIIISTRENKEIREKALNLGASQISGGSLTTVGGYTKLKKDKNSAQFQTSDNRSLDEIINWLLQLGYIPSFCTACYRQNRVGVKFMDLSKIGKIKNFCTPNAIFSLKEYLTNFSSSNTKKIGDELILKELQKISNSNLKNNITQSLNEIENVNKTDIFV